ncbi:hypothetical protein [Brevibacillus brevis]|uniref:hypothetical protein n=1 Tax=Brevibacillus brevis TaxID=1393 RepID=UPI003D19815E
MTDEELKEIERFKEFVKLKRNSRSDRMTYEELYQEATQLGIDIYEMPLKPRIKGLYSDNIIGINKFIPTSIEKLCVLAEELGHYFTSSGDILDQSKIVNRKQEKRARSWVMKNLFLSVHLSKPINMELEIDTSLLIILE